MEIVISGILGRDDDEQVRVLFKCSGEFCSNALVSALIVSEAGVEKNGSCPMNKNRRTNKMSLRGLCVFIPST